jgi:hypothetical protein
VDFFSKASAKLPYRGIAIFLIVAGLSVTVWLFEIIGAVISGVPPITLGIYTSEPTFVIDLGIIAPTAFASAVMILRRKSLGYIGAAILLTLNSLIGIVVISQTIAQNLAGITIGVGQIIAYVGVFVVMGSFAVGLNIRLFRNIIN